MHDAQLVTIRAGDDKGFLWKIGQGDWAFELQVGCIGQFGWVIQVWDISLGNLIYTLDGPEAGIEIAQACRLVVKGLGMWGSVKALGRGYEYLIGVMIFTPVAIVAWFPMVYDFQKRFIFNQAFNRADGNLREFSGEEAWEAIENFSQGQKEWDNPPTIISKQEDKVENLNPQSTSQVLPSFEENTLPVTYLDEVEEIIGIPIEVEPLDKTPLEDLGLNTCNHDIPLSSRKVPIFDELEPQP
ncbi:hypothetical protein Tco_0358803 [Tanacetum coccineum]